ncbi:MAG: hypothetical protein OEW60_02915 [Thiovulaceae bacterium]|nr:hypothetical protein [Sulfurimonadaceae bacterium]
MQILVVIIAMVLGLLYSFNFEGFIFVPAICLFAGLFMVMPTLFNFKLRDFSQAKDHKTIIAKNLLANFLILPLIAIGIGLLAGDFGIAGGLFLLSLLGGGGMVMHWIKKSHANTHIGFILLFINLILLSLSFILFEQFGLRLASYFNNTYYTLAGDSPIHLRGAFMLLVVIPFVVSRILLRFFPKVPMLMQKQRQKLSNISIFIIIFYLFALESNEVLLDIGYLLFIKAFFATLSFYILAFIVAKLFYNTKDENSRAAFWHIVTRYITLALIISTFTMGSFGVTMILPIMIAYFIQVPFAIYYNRHLV